MKNWFFIALMVFFGFTNATDIEYMHPYHVGSVKIQYNENSKTFQVTAKFFLDDLEDAVNQYQKNALYFNKPTQETLMHTALGKYITERLLIKSNQQAVSLAYLGYEVDNESVYIYLESKISSKPKEVMIGINVLYDLFDDQINIVHIKVNGKRKSHKLTYPDIYFTEKW